MSTSAEQMRAYAGPALFSYGFRPFFLFASAWAAIAVALLLPFLAGDLSLPTTLAPLEWHSHEMIYGFAPAVIAGFLLTAVPNWTGRLPVVGAPLAALFASWCAGRAAILVSAGIGPVAAAIIDLLFLASLGTVVAREILAAGNTRNLKVLAVIASLFLGNVLFHLEAIWGLGGGHGTRLGIAAVVLLIMLIGGRIIPSFTRNWLARREPGRLPVPFGTPDGVVMAISGLAMLGWVLAPDARATGWLALAAMAANLYRLSRWAGDRTLAEPLVLVLHVAYAFVPVGFALVALAVLLPGTIAATAAVHGWTAGAVGLMTLAVMTRASLGHTGQSLTASAPICAIYVAAAVAALARVAAGLGSFREPFLYVSATAWIAAFAGFVIVFAPLLMRRRA